ncbi:AraC family transcriptional regulator [Hungatella hathewayi]|nr:AraC family transcriptional regulator [Hungatella hathewayi]RHC48625.1 AraC family transcriptional regulator [Hungatella hathewayi]
MLFVFSQDSGRFGKTTDGFDPDIRISELAEQIGYPADGQYFAKVFKKTTGLVPSEYRKMLTVR